ncbi:rhodanese-like domain-containing protein [Paenibacillus sacheonensis]|uniref:Rhodanese-like domain-containing protein n=1 Tax=Paenibacillus sacheonensis TaxID=742054 RepID=A0A7X5BY33_9BACL|nr:rhodanese-like domain-containing protein [Paenibacillus sacheonensis]MBM7564701.1 rhodanese-related sulfurtransferase [Paenibacillus sacheonensis]NBC69257.1 rhodanese-like domain-containing protein [Paenibacillus sacheonensis]
MGEITASELETRLREGEKLSVIDVREPDEWESGHIKEAVSIPLSVFVERVGELNGFEEPLYMVCRSGNRSGKACDYLSAQGYEVVNVLGGMLSWPGDVATGK